MATALRREAPTQVSSRLLLDVVRGLGGGDLEEQALHGLVSRVTVRTGRHVDFVELLFEDGFARRYGDRNGGQESGVFELETDRKEFLVRVKGRQNKHLDGIQFVTNLGRRSRWFGGGGGEPFQLRAEEGHMIVGLEMGPESFCPCLDDLLLLPRPDKPRNIWIWRLVLHPNVRKLSLAGKPSLFRASFSGKPSLMWLMLRKRAIVLRLMLRGRPSFARLLLDGEQQPEPMSLFRRLCTPAQDGKLSAMQLMMARDPTVRASKSILQLLMSGKPSPIRSFFGKSKCALVPLAILMFQGDEVNGFPALTQLLTERDTHDGVEHPSVFEALLEGEQFSIPSVRRELLAAAVRRRKDSIKGQLRVEDPEDLDGIAVFDQKVSMLRLLNMGEPSLFQLFVEGEREGKESIFRRLVTDKRQDGLSVSRMMMTAFDDHKGHRPALSTYIFGGEHTGRACLLRMLIAGEARPNQLSLMRLLFFKYQRKRRGIFRGWSSKKNLAKPAQSSQEDLDGASEGEDEGNISRGDLFPAPVQQKRSLIDLLTAGTPSIVDLSFAGELEGEDSLARLMLGTAVDFQDGYLRLTGTLKTGSEKGVSLMQMMLVGEEDGGPGISMIRLLLFGEEDNGFSIMRLLLMNESTNEPSLLRIMLTSLKAVLLAAKTRPSQFRNGEWRAQLDKIGQTILGSQKEGASLHQQLNRIAEAINPQGDQFKAFTQVMATIPKRGKYYQKLWKQQWLRVAREIDNAGRRAKPTSIWHTMAPQWRSIAENIAFQRWTKLATDVATLFSSLQALKKWTGRLKMVQAATPHWVRSGISRVTGGSKSRDEHEEEDDAEFTN